MSSCCACTASSLGRQVPVLGRVLGLLLLVSFSSSSSTYLPTPYIVQQCEQGGRCAGLVCPTSYGRLSVPNYLHKACSLRLATATGQDCML